MDSHHGTTIVAVRINGRTAVAGDGQVTLGATITKAEARKVRKLFNGKVICGFAGSTADALTLLGKFEEKLEQHSGNITRAAVELAKDWRTDRILRRLEAMMVVCDKEHMYLLTGNGDVVEPDDSIVGIGSGGPYAAAAARALARHASHLNAAEVAKESLLIASELCIYTNDRIVVEEL